MILDYRKKQKVIPKYVREVDLKNAIKILDCDMMMLKDGRSINPDEVYGVKCLLNEYRTILYEELRANRHDGNLDNVDFDTGIDFSKGTIVKK